MAIQARETEARPPRRVAVVTGAAGGIGRAVAWGLGAAGYRVVLVDQVEPEATRAGLAAAAGPDAVLAVGTDVASEAEARAMAVAALTRFGRIDALVNCAAVYPRQTALEMAAADWRRVLDINLGGVFLCCRTVLPTMIGQGYGRIVSFSSGLARRGARAGSAYAASKAGVEAFMLSLAKKWPPTGLT